MNHILPFPSKVNSIKRLCATIDVGTIIDVGVHDKTQVLIDCFPLHSHILFEPVASLKQKIEENYREVSYTLIQLPLSEKERDVFLIETSLLKDGRPTHSKISETRVPVDHSLVVSCEEIKAVRFDTLLFGPKLKTNYLLKIDVDGTELEVLKGFGKKLNEAAIVIVECTFSTIAARIRFLEDKKFSLVDLVDITYYGNSLYQLDAVFVRKDLLTNGLRPSLDRFDFDLWYEIVE